MSVASELSTGVDAFLQRYENPKTLEQIAPISVVSKLHKIPRHLKNIAEEELLEKLRIEREDPHWVPSPTTEALRNNFWLEYDNAMRNNRRMVPLNIYTGVMHPGSFENFTAEPLKMAWVLCPPISYTRNMDAIMNMGLRRLAQIINMPLNDDPKIAEVILKTVLAIDMRIHGGYTQRSEQKIQSQTIPSALPSSDDLKKLKDIDVRIKELEAKAKKAKALPDVNVLVGLPDKSREV